MQTNKEIYEELTKKEHYDAMQNEINEIFNNILNIKKYFEDVLKKQETYSAEVIQNDQYFKNMYSSYFQSKLPIEKKIANISRTYQNVFPNLINTNLTLQKELRQYYNETNSLLKDLLQSQNDYVANSLKAFKQDNQQLHSSQQKNNELKQLCQSKINFYKQSLDDPTLLYNQNEKEQRYRQVEKYLRKIKENEQNLQINYELMNTRRKALGVDLQELKRLAEEILTNILFKTQKFSKKTLYTFRSFLELADLQFRQNLRYSSQLPTYNEILPHSGDFNYTNTNALLYSPLMGKKDSLNEMTFSQVQEDQVQNEFEGNSFYTLKDTTSLNESVRDFKQSMPFFLLSTFNLETAELIHYPEWVLAYSKKVEEKCKEKIKSIKAVHSYFESLSKICKKQGSPCPKLKIPLLFQGEPSHFIQNMIKMHDMFNLFVYNIHIFLLQKKDQINQIIQSLHKAHVICFSGIENALKELNSSVMVFLKKEGMYQNNRIQLSHNRTLSRDQEQNLRTQTQIQNDAINHLIEDLRNEDDKQVRTMCNIIDTFNQQINDQFKVLLGYQYESYSEQKVHKLCNLSALNFLKGNQAFSLFYKQIKQQNLLDQAISQDLDLKQSSKFTPDQFFQLAKPDDHIITNPDEDLEEEDQNQELDAQLNFVKSKIKVDPGEVLVNTFVCALVEKIQLTGKLYVTSKRLFFHSSFNSHNMFFGDTMLNIPKQEIIRIQKRTKGFIFENSLSVETPKGQLFFTSFFSRDAAYEVIIQRLNPKEQPELVSREEEVNQSIQEVVFYAPTPDEMERIRQREAMVLQAAGESPAVFMTVDIEGVNCQEFFYLIINDSSLGQKNFWAKVKERQGCSEIKVSCWEKEPPKEFKPSGSTSLGEMEAVCLKRTVECIQPLPKSSIPFIPKSCKCQEIQYLHLINLERFYWDFEVHTFDVPYSDCQFVFVRYSVENTEAGVRVTLCFKQNFVKKVIVQSMIEKQTMEETLKNTTQMIIPSIQREVKQYLNRANKNAEVLEDLDQGMEQSIQDQPRGRSKAFMSSNVKTARGCTCAG